MKKLIFFNNFSDSQGTKTYPRIDFENIIKFWIVRNFGAKQIFQPRRVQEIYLTATLNFLKGQNFKVAYIPEELPQAIWRPT